MSRRVLSDHVDNQIMTEVMKMTLKVGAGLVSTKEIARRLGFSEPVIFAHFRTKQELMDRTFAFAWQPFVQTHFFDVGPGIACDQPFSYYKALLLETLSYKKQLMYAQYYLASNYCRNHIVEKVLAPIKEAFMKVFKTYVPELPDEQCRFIARVCISYRIDLASLFISEDYPLTDESLDNAFSIINEGLVQTVASYQPGLLAKIRQHEMERLGAEAK